MRPRRGLLTLNLSDKLGVAVAKAIKFEDIKPGAHIGSAMTKRADGRLVALEVPYPAAAVPVKGSGRQWIALTWRGR